MSTAVEAVTFGCRLNGVESSAMVAAARAGGHRDLAIVNTCAVTAEAVRQARQAVRRTRRAHPARPIVVTGCAATIDPAGFSAMPEVDRIVPNAAKSDPAAWIAERAAATRPEASPPAAERTQTRGFVEVQNGCDHRCTFCIIPFGRGASRSIPPATVLERARALMVAGTREIVLTGVDITAYGADLGSGPRLGTLVRLLLAALPDLPRLRLSSIDCIEADPDLVEALAGESRLMPHLHLSLQSGSDLILKRMARRHRRAESVAFCQMLRRLRPDIVLGADLIAGFPTETEADFAETLALIEDCGLTHLHVFPYSARPGTPAARMPAVPAAVARDRAARLRQAGEAALDRHLSAQVGNNLELLMERGGRGRAPDFTAVRVDPAPAAGHLALVRIAGHDGRELSGTPVGPQA